MAAVEIPLSPQAQTLTVTLGSNTYNLELLWCPASSAWLLSISDTNNNLIIGSIPLVPGLDLLEQYGYLNFGGALYAVSETNPTAPLQYATLGITDHLYFVTP